MAVIPQEFDVILNRLRELNGNIYSQMQILPDNDHDLNIIKFKATAAKLEYKQIAEFYVNEFAKLISLIQSKKNSMFDNLPDYGCLRMDEIVEGSMDESLVYIEQPGFLKEEYYTKVTDELQKSLKKRLRVELMAYDNLLREFKAGSNLHWNNPFFTDENTAWAICNFEFGPKKFISNDNDSQNNFIQLFTQEDLEDYDIKKMTIKISCNNEEAAYIFSKLFNINLIRVSINNIHKHGCFCNSSGERFRKDLSPYLSKFKNSPDDNKQKMKFEIDTEINNLEDLLQKTRVGK